MKYFLCLSLQLLSINLATYIQNINAVAYIFRRNSQEICARVHRSKSGIVRYVRVYMSICKPVYLQSLSS
jgi:hypothetical protein